MELWKRTFEEVVEGVGRYKVKEKQNIGCEEHDSDHSHEDYWNEPSTGSLITATKVQAM